VHEDCPLPQIVKIAEALEPPPPPPLQAVVQPAGGGDGGLKTVTLTATLEVLEFASRPEGTVAVI
jgi:hypothetical protein